MIKQLKDLINNKNVEVVTLWKDREAPSAGFSHVCSISMYDEDDYVGYGRTMEKAVKSAIAMIESESAVIGDDDAEGSV